MRNTFKRISAYIPSPLGRVRVGVLFLLLPFTFNAQTNTFPASGNVGIGTTNPTSKLEVKGEIKSNGLIQTVNPNNPAANLHLSWFNNVARIRIGGDGEGAENGLDIQGIGNKSIMRLLNNGNIGIGVTNPTMKLTVDGSIRNNSFSLSGSNGDLYMKRGNSDTNWKRALVCWDTSLTLNFDGDFSNGVRVMGNKFSVDGNMGIGTDNAAGWKLAVNGNIRAKEIKVETGW
ncbi:hypothetical protein ED312_23335, partial [Sinomicrobium pectinilyticum]